MVNNGDRNCSSDLRSPPGCHRPPLQEEPRCAERPRLHRLRQLYVSHPVYFVTACTHERQRLLNNPAAHDAFKQFTHEAMDRGVHVGRYVMMPDHLHLFVAFSVADTVSLNVLSAWVRSLKVFLSKTWRLQGVPAPHWQKGFFDHILRSSESYAEKWQYVAQNPVRAGLVKPVEEWSYQGEICPLDL